MAFMLPSVSLSEAGSETDSMSCYSDLDPAMSPYTSLSSMTGSNIYSQSLSLLSPHASPRSLPATVRSHLKSPTALPRFSSLPKPVQKYQDQDGEDQGSNSRSLGKVGVRLTYRSDKNELLVMELALILHFISISTLMLLSLQVKVLRAENIPINYKTQTAKTSVKVAILPSRFSKVGIKIIIF